jgi:hypothetical protein
MVLDARDDRRKAEETFKQAILSADPMKYLPLLYPEMTTQRVDAETLTQEDLDEAGEWQFEEKIDPREAEQILSTMLASAGGSMGLDDIEQFEH